MLGRAHTANATSKKVAAKNTFTMQSLWRLALWGSTAAVALFVAVLMSRGDLGSQRAVLALSSLNLLHPSQATPQIARQTVTPAPSRPSDPDSATRQLVQAVRSLTEDRDRLTARIAAVEHNLDDMTGSISRQIEAAKAASAQAPSPWPDDKPPVPQTPATIASIVAPAVPPLAGLAPPLPPGHLMPAAAQSIPGANPSASSPMAYGADMGSAHSIKSLQTRWAGVHAAHPQLFAGLEPVVTLRESPQSNRTELRLVVGPLPSAEAAAQLCASLAAFRLFCQPTMFDGRHLALR